MEEIENAKIKEVLMNIVERSHQTIANVQSNATNELKTTLAVHTEILSRIEKQTIKTNGRVSSLETWRWITIGGLSIISAIVLPLTSYIFVNTENKINKMIEVLDKHTFKQND
jgi:hypothetical protein